MTKYKQIPPDTERLQAPNPKPLVRPARRVSTQLDPKRLRIYLITDFGDRNAKLVLQAVSAAIAAGVTAVQYRDKEENRYERRRVRAIRIKAMAAAHGALFVVNDDVDLALEIGADGVHLGLDDADPTDLRKELGPSFVIGGSAGTVERAVALERAGVDYLGVGAIYEARQSKATASPPRGTAAIKMIKQHVSLPIVGVGGITPDNAGSVFSAGADGVAVIRSVLDSDNPGRVVARLWSAWKTMQ